MLFREIIFRIQILIIPMLATGQRDKATIWMLCMALRHCEACRNAKMPQYSEAYSREVYVDSAGTKINLCIEFRTIFR